MRTIEHRAHALWSSGAVERWFQGADPRVRQVSARVNGPLLEELAETVEHADAACVDLFRDGAPVYGSLPIAGIGECLVVEEVCVTSRMCKSTHLP